MHAMQLRNSTATIGRVVCWKFVKTGSLDHQVAASEEVAAVTVVRGQGLVVVEAASVVVGVLVVAMVVVVATVVAMEVLLEVALSTLLHLLQELHHPIRLPTTLRPEGSQASLYMFATYVVTAKRFDSLAYCYSCRGLLATKTLSSFSPPLGRSSVLRSSTSPMAVPVELAL